MTGKTELQKTILKLKAQIEDKEESYKAKDEELSVQAEAIKVLAEEVKA